MAFGDWNKVLAEYQDVYLQSRYTEHARGIIALISRITADDAFDDVIPGTSLATLFLEVPNRRTQVHIWCEQPNLTYTVYLYHPESGSSEKQSIDDGEIVHRLKMYIEDIKSS